MTEDDKDIPEVDGIEDEACITVDLRELTGDPDMTFDQWLAGRIAIPDKLDS